MKKLHNNTDGFSAVELLIVLIVLVFIGGGGYLVVHRMHNKKSATTTNTTSSTAATTPANVYANWKSYCDTPAKFCLKYPVSWMLTDQSEPSIGVAQTIMNVDSTADVQYADFLPAVGDPLSVTSANPLSSAAPAAGVTMDLSGTYNFYVSSISPLANNDSTHQVVGGYYASATENIPSYFVVDSSKITTQSLQSFKAGQTVQLHDNAFNLENSLEPSNIILFGGGPVADTPYTAPAAKAWLTSTHGKAVLQLLQSFSVE